MKIINSFIKHDLKESIKGEADGIFTGQFTHHIQSFRSCNKNLHDVISLYTIKIKIFVMKVTEYFPLSIHLSVKYNVALQ